MTATAFDKRRRREFTPTRYATLPEEKRPVFILRDLDVFDRAEVAELSVKKVGEARATIETVRMIVAGWRNHRFEDGTEAPFETRADGRPNDDTLRCIHDRDLAEIFTDALAHEEVTTKEAGE